MDVCCLGTVGRSSVIKMSLSKLDLFYRKLILTKFYTRGWGRPDELRRLLEFHNTLVDRKACADFLARDYKIVLEELKTTAGCSLLNGKFVTPLYDVLPDLIPEECRTAYFQLVLPSDSKEKNRKKNPGRSAIFKDLNLKPVCIHMAGTGDHGYSWRRELLAKPLLENNISSLLLENPFYGLRKPKDQTGSGLLHVKDLFIMGSCLILEAQVLLNWLTKQGYGPLGLTGISMGGHMASLAATNWLKPIALVPCMSWTSSSVVWTDGVLSKAIPWRVLENQYARNPAYEKEINEILKQNTVNSYELGREYVKGKGEGRVRGEADLTDPVALKKQNNNQERRQKETLLFMKGVMDQMTDLQNFCYPIDPSMVTFVVAKADAYYPLSKLRPMSEVWPGCEVGFSIFPF